MAPDNEPDPQVSLRQILMNLAEGAGSTDSISGAMWMDWLRANGRADQVASRADVETRKRTFRRTAMLLHDARRQGLVKADRYIDGITVWSLTSKGHAHPAVSESRSIVPPDSL